jgi:glycosyltransferase involved in cell wall biosynthesis
MMRATGNQPRVTVCVPTRNRADWLRRSIASVLAQTYTDFTLLVSDNASEDETPEVVNGFDDPRITYIRLPEDVGLVGNHNQVLARVESEYVLILPDDDIAYPELLETAVETLDRHPRAGMVHSNLDMIDARDEILAGDVNWTLGLTSDTVESGAEFIRESMKYSCRVCASSALMRTAALPRGFFDEADFPPVDLGLWLRMALEWDMAFVARTLCGYRIHDSSHSAAFGDAIGPGYRMDSELLERLVEVKLSFVDRHRDSLARPSSLRRLAEASLRRELLLAARLKTLPDRRFVATVSALREAANEDPRVMLNKAAWKLLGGSVLGPRLTAKLQQRGSGGVA